MVVMAWYEVGAQGKEDIVDCRILWPDTEDSGAIQMTHNWNLTWCELVQKRVSGSSEIGMYRMWIESNAWWEEKKREHLCATSRRFNHTWLLG